MKILEVLDLHRQQLLILVHPGSACGSADYNIPYSSESGRHFLTMDLNSWTGNLLVIDGELSDELALPKYAQWGNSINQAIDRCRSGGFITERLMGDDGSNFDQREAASQFVSKYQMQPNEWLIHLTGAWADDEDGCVTSVYQALSHLGYRCDIRDSALKLSDDEWERPRDPDEEGDEEYEAGR